jgi:hypothetical protein
MASCSVAPVLDGTGMTLLEGKWRPPTNNSMGEPRHSVGLCTIWKGRCGERDERATGSEYDQSILYACMETPQQKFPQYGEWINKSKLNGQKEEVHKVRHKSEWRWPFLLLTFMFPSTSAWRPGSLYPRIAGAPQIAGVQDHGLFFPYPSVFALHPTPCLLIVW